jgi:hypothetical protein
MIIAGELEGNGKETVAEQAKVAVKLCIQGCPVQIPGRLQIF